ncbi:MAG: endonuclease/exonuclease/phosphatase family protein [Patescibacteria group bacterium]|nr:endonuclease/exonuclease/phosphatase family protein [Patescibacteria group bacterium]
MKVISLNTWAGTVKEPLLDFLRSKKNEIDVFCFQEVLNGGREEAGKIFQDKTKLEYDLFPIMQEILPNYTSFFRPNFSNWIGLAIFVRKNFNVLDEGELFVYGSPIENFKKSFKFYPRNIQYVTININKKPITIINFHGLWSGKEKTDNKERINQSKKILNFMKGINNEFLICGDFNLEPNTESLKIIEDFGLRNLIKDYSITSTRTSFYKYPVKFADYVLTSKGIKVKKFKILPDEVSDHAPIYLELE